MKHIVITGSTRGIGFALAIEFLRHGHKVTINGTCQESIDNALKSLSQEFNSELIHPVIANVSKLPEVEALWDSAVKNHGPIDIWINNAGIDQSRHLISEIDVERVQKIVNINIVGVFNGSSVATKRMTEQGHGFIYNMEGFGSNGQKMPRLSIYGTSKRAVRYFTESLVLETKNLPVKVGFLNPGMVLTDFLTNGLPEDPKEKERTINIYNILADKPETVGKFLAEHILSNTKHGKRISWLTGAKVMYRFATASIIKRKLIE